MFGKLIAVNNLLIYMASFVFNLIFSSWPPANKVNFSLFLFLSVFSCDQTLVMLYFSCCFLKSSWFVLLILIFVYVFLLFYSAEFWEVALQAFTTWEYLKDKINKYRVTC